MPITEDNFTLAELDAVLEKNPALLKEITPALEKRKYKVFDEPSFQEQENTYNSNLTSRIAKKNEEVTKILSGLDKSNDKEKWYEYNGRVIKTLKTERDSFKTRIDLLEGKSDITAEERQSIIDLRKQLADKGTEMETFKAQKDAELGRFKLQNELLSETAKVDSTLKKDEIFKDAIDVMREVSLKKLLDGAKTSDEGVTVYFINGKALKNADQSFMTGEQAYAHLMDKFINKGVKGSGSGGNGEGNAEDSIVTNLKSQYELNAHLRTKGLIMGTLDHQKEFKRLGGDKLPLQ